VAINADSLATRKIFSLNERLIHFSARAPDSPRECELPKTNVGKILRRALRDELRAATKPAPDTVPLGGAR